MKVFWVLMQFHGTIGGENVALARDGGDIRFNWTGFDYFWDHFLMADLKKKEVI